MIKFGKRIDDSTCLRYRVNLRVGPIFQGDGESLSPACDFTPSPCYKMEIKLKFISSFSKVSILVNWYHSRAISEICPMSGVGCHGNIYYINEVGAGNALKFEPTNGYCMHNSKRCSSGNNEEA